MAFLPALLLAQTFQASQTQIAIAVTPSANHQPLRVPIVAGPGGLSLVGVTVKSDSLWVTPTLDTAGNALVLTFATTGLVNASYTATITLSDGTHSSQVFVNAAVSALNVVSLLDDPTRSRTYGIQQVGLNLGSIVIFDPIQQTYVGSITVGLKPTDLAISADGNELLVICSASQAIYVINLQTLAVTGTIALPVYADWGPASTSAHVAYGPGNIIYYTDGAWDPVLHVLNRATGVVMQNLYSDNTNSPGNSFGFGAIAVSGDKKMLFGWGQYGWSAGSANSFVVKFSGWAQG